MKTAAECQFKVGDRVRIAKFPGGARWVGMCGAVRDFEGKGSKTQVLLSLDNNEGGLWVSEQWLECEVNPGAMTETAAPSQVFPRRAVEAGATAIYQNKTYYSEVKKGVWRTATPEDISALRKGDRVAIANQKWVYIYLRWDSVEAEAVVKFVGYNFRTRIPCNSLQVEDTLAEQGDSKQRSCDDFKEIDNSDRVVIKSAVESITVSEPSSSTLDTLALEICALYGQLEEAENVAASAAQSALAFARDMGTKLLEAKKECGHGRWEEWRKQIKSPHTGQPMPSSTATLYQRVAKRWEEMEKSGVTTLRDAALALKGDRTPSTSKPAMEAAAVAEINIGDENNTPEREIVKVRRVLGGIDLDPASNDLAQQTIQAGTYYTIDNSGLDQPWAGRIWLNPPYSYPKVEQFTQKLLESWKAGRIAGAICLVNNCTDARWFQELARSATVRLDLSGRISDFHNPYKSYEKSGNRQGQTYFYFGQQPDRFYEVFADRGIFYPSQSIHRDLPEALESVQQRFEEKKRQAEERAIGTSLTVYRPDVSAEEFGREMQRASDRFGGCHSCKNRRLTRSGNYYACKAHEFDNGIVNLPLSQNWFEQQGGCKSFESSAQATTALNAAPIGVKDSRAGMPAIQKAVWEWLNLNGIEVQESAATAAADMVFEFLQSQFLEVESDD